jgi:deoxyadenosine/deoxycytidine kinase
MSTQERPRVKAVKVCVEGNIGSGKSTALERLACLRPDVTVVQEPVEEWGDLLAAFYKDPATWGFAMQMSALLSFGRRADAADVVERSPLSCRHVFGQLLFNDGKMTHVQWGLYKQYYDALGWSPDVVVYVHTPPDECHRRLVQRDRPAEQGVDVHYLKRLDFQYETMLRYAAVPVVRLDGHSSPDDLAVAIADVVDRARLKAAAAAPPTAAPATTTAAAS